MTTHEFNTSEYITDKNPRPCCIELDQLKAENEALKASVAVLVDVMAPFREEACKQFCKPEGHSDECLAISNALGASKQTADAYTKRVQEEAVKAEIDLLKNPIYCAICGSCGEEGCCSEQMCENYGEIQELRAQVTVLVEALKEFDGSMRFAASVFFGGMRVGIPPMSCQNKRWFERFYPRYCDTLDNLQPRADAYTKRVQQEAVRAERERIAASLRFSVLDNAQDGLLGVTDVISLRNIVIDLENSQQETTEAGG